MSVFIKLSEETDSILKHAIALYGPDDQIDKAQEELGELVTAIARWRNYGKTDNTYSDDVAQEVADVMIMCLQLAKIFPSVPVEYSRKMGRLKEMVANEGDRRR